MMVRSSVSGDRRVNLRSSLAALLLTILGSVGTLGQTTIGTGSIQGVIIDPSDAVISGAQVTITNPGTGQALHLSTSSSGAYASGALLPGDYQLRVAATGFQTTEMRVTVQVGVTSPGNLQLRIGMQTQVVEVPGSAVTVNTEQAIVQGVLSTEQIERLPINGRNFLDLAQLEPGVQMQDGSNFDPSKTGFSSISFGGRFGRTARIELDGVDVSDEGTGTTTQNIPASAVLEFQLSQSSLDLSTELTSSGAINVVTRSGTNKLHGQLFDLFRDSSAAAQLPSGAPFQRHQFGGNLGGPIIRDKLFFFVDGERTKQDLLAPVPLSSPFSDLSGGFQSPFRETMGLGRLDWNLNSARLFYRYSYFQNLAVATAFGAISFQPFRAKNYARVHAVGADFNRGSFSHSFRFSYLNFADNVSDAVRGTSLPLASFPVSINIGPLGTGPNFLAPQTTLQHNHQVKYDGSKVLRSHILRYGVSFTRTQTATDAKLFSLTPSAFTALGAPEMDFADNSCGTGNPCFPGGSSNPLNYPVELVLMGNGLGNFTELPGLGLPAGRFGPDNRLGLYLGDTWKIKPNLTLTAGLRYVRDTGRSNSDLPAIAAVNAVLPGMGNPVRQPNHNFAPQLGLAYDPWKNGKTVFRAGIGLFYENGLWQNVFQDRGLRLSTGGFVAFPVVCFPGFDIPVVFADGSLRTVSPDGCPGASGNPVAIGNAGPVLAVFQQQFESTAAAVGSNAANPNSLANLIASPSTLPTAAWPLAPNYQTPRSIQINAGVQRELRPGTVISADYLRNVSLHFLLAVDPNHTGDARFLDRNAALAAISATNNLFGCGTGTDAAAIDCAIANGATMVAYAGNGLDSPTDLGLGRCGVALVGVDCAFPGINPAAGSVPFLFPIGRSVYNGLQVKLLQQADHLAPGLEHLNLQVSYTLSRYVSPGGSNPSLPNPTNLAAFDQDFLNAALDNRNPLGFTGPSTLDRTHQLSVGAIADLPHSFRLSLVSHIFSALPMTLLVPNTALGPGEIFRTDFTGDGTVQDILPGTAVGSFGRGISAGTLNSVIQQQYNSNVAGTLTPAGEALVAAGLFTQAQLLNMQGTAVAPPVALAPPGEVGLGGLRTFDLKLGWAHTFHERITVEPSVAIFNLFNFANFDLPSSMLTGLLTGQPGAVNGTTSADRIINRVGLGTGVFALGAPRVFEFGLKITF